MPMPYLELDDRQIAVYLETNQQVDLKRLADFLGAISEYASDFFEDDPRLELSQLRTGSVIAVMTAWGAIAGGVGTMGLFAIALADRIESYRQRKIERRAAEHVLDDGVVRFEFGAKGIENILVPAANVAAIQTILYERENTARPPLEQSEEARSLRYLTSDPDEQTALDVAEEEDAMRQLEKAGFDYLVTEKGEPIVTENGDAIRVTDAGANDEAIDVDESLGWMEVAGQFVQAFDGRFAMFRSGARQYRVYGPAQILRSLPVEREVIVEANFSKRGDLVLNRWRDASLGEWQSPTT